MVYSQQTNQNEKALQIALAHQLQAWFDAAPQACYLFSLDEKMNRVNNLGKEYAINYGLKENNFDELNHSNIADIFHITNADKYFQDTIKQAKKHTFEHKIHQKYVGEVWLEIEYNPLVYDNKISGVALSIQDITSRKKAKTKILAQKNELEALNKVKDKLFSIISHDFRSPLTSLRSFFNLLKVYEISPERTKEVLNQIDIQLATTSEFLDNILFWTKSQMKGLQLNFEILNFNHILNNVINLINNSLIQKNIILTNHTNQNIEIFADSQTVHLILRNLLMNAIKFTNINGFIDIFTELREEYVCIGIKDSGIGISEEAQKILFQIGKQVAKGTSNETGHGFGLWICKDFIEKNNGKIWLESQLNQGSTFWFSLPIKK